MAARAQSDSAAMRRIVGSGTPEHEWQSWPFLEEIPRLSLGQLVSRHRRLVVVAPHPDDEVLACGGLIAAHVARGGACLVVAVTDGEASHPQSATWTRQRLAKERRQESQLGLGVLGVPKGDVVRLGLPDGELASHGEPIRTALRLLLTPVDLVITTWRYDGHPDHEATGLAVAEVCMLRRLPYLEAPVWMWNWATPDSATVPWSRLVGFCPGREALSLKKEALAAHATQLTARDGLDPSPVLDAEIQKRALRNTELFFDGTRDLL